MKNENKENKNKDRGEETNAEFLKAELKVLREEIAKKDDYYDKFLRIQAEFDNFRKRALQEKASFIKFANEELISELVRILDDFERGIKSIEQKKDFGLLHQGVDMISKQLHKLLEERGLKRIISVGEKFNPVEHEAIEVVEGESKQDGIVVEELQPGYMLNGRVIRPAKVKVVKSGLTPEGKAPERENKEV